MPSSHLKLPVARTLRLLSLAAAGALAAALPSLHAQVAPASQPFVGDVANPDSFYGKEPTEGVYVRDSTTAVEKLTNAQRMERLKEWGKAADYYQEVISKYPDRVVPSQLDKDKRIYQYTSITFRVQERLAHWPADGLDTYRARYETPAQALLDNAKPDDVSALNKVYAQYFVTDAGKQAGIKLMDLYIEAGEFPAAAWLGDRLLDLHPNLAAERAAVLYRTALAYYYAGDAAKAQARQDQLKTKFAADRGTVRGKEVLLADSLAQETREPVTTTQTAAADSWRMVGGDESRGRVGVAEGRPGARLYGIALSKPNWTVQQNNQRMLLETQYKSAVDDGLTLGVMPVTDRGELYFQDGVRLYAVSLESGVPLPGWAQTYPSGAYMIPGGVWGSPRMRQLSCTLTDHDVLAIMGQPDAQAQLVGSATQSEGRLVCLDRDNGRDRWTVTLSQLPDEGKEARTAHLTGSPLVVGDSVLVIARGSKPGQQFDDCYVIAFDVATGKFRWSTYVASASEGPQMFGMNGVPFAQAENASHLAYANGRVYVQTNLGALAALDAYSGAVVWLDIYPTGRQAAERQPFNPFVQQNQIQQPQERPWTFNPVIAKDGYVFTLPSEGRNLLIYDAGTGVEFKRIDLRDVERKANRDGTENLSKLETLLGVVGDEMVLAGEKGLICLNWRNYAPEKFDPTQDNITCWIVNLPQPIRGRGFLTSDAVHVSCAERMYRVSLKSGKTIGEYPKHPSSGSGGGWEPPEGPGNLLVTSDHVIVAGASMVNVYTDLTLARQKLDREIAATPTEAQPRLRYAEVMFVAGEPDLALAKLDEAAGLIGGLTALQPGQSRARLFSDALTFAEKLNKATTAPDERARVNKLYDRAAAAADTPVQQVRVRMSRAKFDEAQNDFDGAVKLYQEVLSDAALRPVPLVDEAQQSAGAPLQADAVAQRAIAAIIKSHPSAYEPFQQAAAAALEQAQGAGDESAAKLLAVARQYPNATVAARAMLAAGEAYEAKGDPRQAIRVLRDIWFKYPQNPDKASVLESVARNYLTLAAAPRASAGNLGPMDNMEAAAAALAREASLAGAAAGGSPALTRPLKLRDGTVIEKGTPVSAALEAVRKYRGQEVVRALPDFHVPLPPRHGTGQKRAKPFLPAEPGQVIANVKALVLPLREFTRNDRVVTFSTQGTIDVHAAGPIAPPLGSSAALAEEPKGCAWVGDNLLVWGGSQLASTAADSQQPAWKVDLATMAPIEVVKLDDVAQNVPSNNLAGNNVIVRGGQVIVRNGQRVFFQPPNMRGGIAVAQPVQAIARPAGGGGGAAGAGGGAEQIVDVRPVGDRVLLTTTSGRIMSVELGSGRVAWQTRLSDRPVDRLVANEDFAVVKVTDNTAVRIAAFDTATGQMRCTQSWLVQGGTVPVNLALAPDGTLVYTLPKKLCLKDLYKPWPDASDKESAPAAPTAQDPFGGASQAEHLLISEGRILALADNGAEKYVRVHSLETGQPVLLQYRTADGCKDVERNLNAGKSWNIGLRVVGSHLYVLGQDGVISYNLDRPAETWTSTNDPSTRVMMHDAFIGQQFLALLDEPVDDAALGPVGVAPGVPGVPGAQPNAGAGENPPPAPATQPVDPNAPAGAAGAGAGANNAQPNPVAGPSTQYRLQLFGRYPVSEKNPAESGRLDYLQTVADPAGITPAWVATDGGFYYLTADNKLHLLRGSRAEK